MATIHDVASYIVDRFESPITTMKLQKLTYFSQGWALAILDEPLFKDEFQAWRNGPVARALYDAHRGQYTVGHWAEGAPLNLTVRQQLVIDAVLKNYGALSGQQLSEISHDSDGPWAVARHSEGVGDGQRGNATIPKGSIAEHFKRVLGVGKFHTAKS